MIKVCLGNIKIMSIKIVEMFFVELCNILYKKYINNCCLVYLKEY